MYVIWNEQTDLYLESFGPDNDGHWTHNITHAYQFREVAEARSVIAIWFPDDDTLIVKQV